jgi:hypothetical protein
MNIQKLLVGLFFEIVITGCAPLQVIGLTITASPSYTTTYTLTSTTTPTQANTPTITRTPTETPVTRPEYATSAEKLEDFTIVERLYPIVQDILDNPTWAWNETIDFIPIWSYREAGVEGVYLECEYGTNCLARVFVRVADPSNGPDRWYVIWEVRNPGDSQSKVLITYIGDNETGDDLRIGAQRMLNKINKRMYRGRHFHLTLLTRVIDGTLDNPVLTEMYPIDMSTDKREALDMLEDDFIISDELRQFPIWLKDLW